MYVFDDSPLSALFRNYYPKRFPTLWTRFRDLVDSGQITSTREVLREINDSSLQSMIEWAASHPTLFSTPTAAEAAFVTRIYSVTHFQQNIQQQKLLKGGRLADPFVIAKAAINGKSVVTMEFFKPNAVKIPNTCKHFGVQCLTLEQFMEKQAWTF